MTRRPYRTRVTPIQRATLDYLEGHLVEHQRMPTVKEIGAAFDINTNAAQERLRALERKQLVARGGGRARAVKLLHKRIVLCDT